MRSPPTQPFELAGVAGDDVAARKSGLTGVRVRTQTQTHLREGILFISWPGSGLKPARAQLITTHGTAAAAAARRRQQRQPSKPVPHHAQSSDHTQSSECGVGGRSHNSYVYCITPNYTEVRCETRPGGPLTPQSADVRVVELIQRRRQCSVASSRPSVPCGLLKVPELSLSRQ